MLFRWAEITNQGVWIWIRNQIKVIHCGHPSGPTYAFDYA